MSGDVKSPYIVALESRLRDEDPHFQIGYLLGVAEELEGALRVLEGAATKRDREVALVRARIALRVRI